MDRDDLEQIIHLLLERDALLERIESLTQRLSEALDARADDARPG